MARVATCEKCGLVHLVGGECIKPTTPRSSAEWVEKQLRNLDEFERASEEAAKKDNRRACASTVIRTGPRGTHEETGKYGEVCWDML